MLTPRILFVDDEPHVLDGLRDGLRRKRREWEMTFALGGREALAHVHSGSFDVVVSDVRMPGIDGIAVLAEVQRHQSAAVRIVLSGFAESHEVARAALVAHQFIAKPCEPDELRSTIERALELRDAGQRIGLDDQLAGIAYLPSPPGVYAELGALLSDEQPDGATIDAVSALLTHDIALSAKVLQLANSAFFSHGSAVSTVPEALACLGLDLLKTLVLSAEAFGKLRPDPPIDGFDVDGLQHRSATVARVARQILAEHPGRDTAAAAGLLADLGQLVLACNDRAYFTEMIDAARRSGRPLVDVERERRSFTHAELGAYLLAIWGLPGEIVAAVSRHHNPIASASTGLDAVTTVYLADTAVAECEYRLAPDSVLPPSRLDLAYLDGIGLTDQLTRFRDLAEHELAVA